jgi:hypothetical protein
MLHWRSCLGLMLSGAVLAACSDQGTQPLPSGRDSFPRTASLSVVPEERPDEAEMAELAGRIPELAGYHFEDGELVVSLTDMGRSQAARSALARVAARGNGRMHVRPARYTFLELRGWRDDWSDRVLEVPGVAFVDLDEAANQVVVGIAEPAARGRVLALLRLSGIPAPALGFETAGYAQPQSLEEYAPYLDTWPTQGDSITAFRRPLEGGLKITCRRSGSSPDAAITCTLGFIARLNGVRVAITASHCSQRHWDRDQTSYFQSTPGVGRYFGYEYRDPNGSSCGFLSPNVCRNSDASAIALEPDVTDNLGYIVRPVGPPPIGRSATLLRRSPLLVDAANPAFRIIARRGPGAGEQVAKLGATTGWTSGPVRKTCVDMPADRSYSKLRCQSWVDLSSDEGDSGGPVFIMHVDGTATLAGMLWGVVTDAGQQYATFSSIAQIEKDLGGLQVMPGSSTGGGGDPGDGGGSLPGPGPGDGGICCIN